MTSPWLATDVTMKRTCCLAGFVVYLVAMLLFLLGFGGPYWIHYDNYLGLGIDSHNGLWQSCTEGDCNTIKLSNTPAWFQAVAAMMIIALIAALVAGATCMILPFTAVAQGVAGTCTLIAVIIYTAKTNEADSGRYLSWSFGTSCAAGLLFQLNSMGIGMQAYLMSCDTRSVWPW